MIFKAKHPNTKWLTQNYKWFKVNVKTKRALESLRARADSAIPSFQNLTLGFRGLANNMAFMKEAMNNQSKGSAINGNFEGLTNKLTN